MNLSRIMLKKLFLLQQTQNTWCIFGYLNDYFVIIFKQLSLTYIFTLRSYFIFFPFIFLSLLYLTNKKREI